MNLHEPDPSELWNSKRPKLGRSRSRRRAEDRAPYRRSAASLCQHTLLDYYGCDSKLLRRTPQVKTLLCKAVIRGGGKIVKAVFHNFSPYGVSGVVVITESHVTIHTWPEYGYAAVDVFSCSSKLDHAAISEALKQSLSAKAVRRKSFARGQAR